jgi:hypothetical protein
LEDFASLLLLLLLCGNFSAVGCQIRRIVERRRGVTKNKKKKMEASLTTGEAGENFLLVM